MKKSSDVHKDHRIRLRRRFRADGIDNFEPHNVLELLLFYSFSRCDTNELAHELIDHYGSLPLVFDAPYDDLVKRKGVGEVSATLIKMVPAITSYYMSQKALEGVVVNSAEDAGQYFVAKFLNAVVEEFHLLSLSATGKVIRCTKISEGTVNAVPVLTRMVLAEALNSNAVSVVAAHNHPSGITLPSSNDTFLTQNLYRALKHADITLDDHIIVSGKEVFSLRESGYFDKLPDYSSLKKL